MLSHLEKMKMEYVSSGAHTSCEKTKKKKKKKMFEYLTYSLSRDVKVVSDFFLDICPTNLITQSKVLFHCLFMKHLSSVSGNIHTRSGMRHDRGRGEKKNPTSDCASATGASIRKKKRSEKEKREAESANASPYTGRRRHWFSAGYRTPREHKKMKVWYDEPKPLA